MQQIIKKVISLINTTILSINSKNKVATPKIAQPIMYLWNGNHRCRYGKLLDGVHPLENSQAEWKNTVENILTKNPGNPSKNTPKLSHRQHHPVPLIMMTQMGKTVMPARKGVGSASVNVSTSANVWVNVARLPVCLEQPGCWPLSPGWERQIVTHACPATRAFLSWGPGFLPTAC